MVVTWEGRREVVTSEGGREVVVTWEGGGGDLGGREGGRW